MIFFYLVKHIKMLRTNFKIFTLLDVTAKIKLQKDLIIMNILSRN